MDHQAQKDGQTATQTVEVEQVGPVYTVEMAYFSATLTATAVAGATVTATCGRAVVTGQAAGNGQAALEIKLPGNYVVQATMANSYGKRHVPTARRSTWWTTAAAIRPPSSHPADGDYRRRVADHHQQGRHQYQPDWHRLGPGISAQHRHLAVTASKDDLDASAEVECSAYQDYSVELAYIQEVLGDNSWEMIKRVADADEGANWWSVGDTKSIVLTAKTLR